MKYFLLEGDLGDLAYAIGLLVMAVFSAFASHLKKKKEKAKFEQKPGKGSVRPQPETQRKIEELIEVFLPKEVTRQRTETPAPRPPVTSIPARPVSREPAARPPRPAAKPARPVKTPPPERQSLSALRAKKVVIDSIEHARHISEEAQITGRSAEELARHLQGRYESAADQILARQRRGSKSRRPLLLSKARIRQAIILNEIISKPVALRAMSDRCE